MMHFDVDTYLPEDILTKVDRMSMAHSIESRVPLLDHDVVAFAASLPHAYEDRARRAEAGVEAGGGAHPSGRGARRAASRASVCPSATWFRGPLKDFMADTLQSARARQRGYFKPRFVDRLVAEHLVRAARPCVATVAAPDVRALAPAVPRWLGQRSGQPAG